jgi:hypothetical protein
MMVKSFSHGAGSSMATTVAAMVSVGLSSSWDVKYNSHLKSLNSSYLKVWLLFVKCLNVILLQQAARASKSEDQRRNQNPGISASVSETHLQVNIY